MTSKQDLRHVDVVCPAQAAKTGEQEAVPRWREWARRQRAVVAYEGGRYDTARFLRPESVARVVLLAVTAAADADVTEVSIRPAAH